MRKTAAHFLEKPVNHFYMLMVSTSVLVVLGLIMVFSASSIHAIDTKGYAFAVVVRQFVFLLVGIPFALYISKLPLERWEQIARL